MALTYEDPNPERTIERLRADIERLTRERDALREKVRGWADTLKAYQRHIQGVDISYIVDQMRAATGEGA